MQARMENPVIMLPEVLQAIFTLNDAGNKAGVPKSTLELVHLRASQINGCSYCVGLHSLDLKKNGETDERIFSVSAWREAPFFNDAERAALALTEAATRLSDRPDPVPDEVWDNAVKYYDKNELAQLILNIAMINYWNRINVTIGQVAGKYPGE